MGFLCVVAHEGLLLSNTTIHQELTHIENNLSHKSVVKRLDECLSTFQNVMASNDSFVMLHTCLYHATKELVADMLGPDVLRTSI